MLTSCTLPLVMLMNVGMLPCRSSSVCILTAALCFRNLAQGNNEKHRSMVVESSAYRLCSNSTPIGSDADRKSTRLNSSHLGISYAVFCLKKKKKHTHRVITQHHGRGPAGCASDAPGH